MKTGAAAASIRRRAESCESSADGVSITCATVVSGGPPYAVKTAAALRHAQKAASCLIQPAPGDVVLIASTPEQPFIISVLARAGETSLQLSTEAELTIAAGGKLTLSAGGGVEVATGRNISMISRKIDIHSMEATISVDTTSYLGTSLLARVRGIRLVAESIHSLVETALHHAKRLFRRVDEIEQVEAASIDYRAREAISLSGRHLLGTAAELVKFDGEQIHLG
jgi:uncharacterized protein (DUF2345 family)